MTVLILIMCISCLRVSAKDASFELRLHLIYLINDILHHWLVLTVPLSVAVLMTFLTFMFCIMLYDC